MNRIVEEVHNGKIRFESEYMEGTTFYDSFDIAVSGVATSSDGKGAKWTKHALREGNSNFSQCTPYPSLVNGYITLFCTLGGRRGPAYLTRVSPSEATNVSAYRYFVGGRWLKDPNAATIVIDGFVGELSIGKNPAGGFIALYKSSAASGLAYSTAGSLTGPWSGPVTFYYFDPYGGFSYGTYAPQIIGVRGMTFIIFFSRWDDYSVYAAELTL